MYHTILGHERKLALGRARPLVETMTSDITHEYGKLWKRVRLDYTCKVCQDSFDDEMTCKQHIEATHEDRTS